MKYLHLHAGRRLGHGVFADVFESQWSDAAVALKIPSSSSDDDDDDADKDEMTLDASCRNLEQALSVHRYLKSRSGESR